MAVARIVFVIFKDQQRDPNLIYDTSREAMAKKEKLNEYRDVIQYLNSYLEMFEY